MKEFGEYHDLFLTGTSDTNLPIGIFVSFLFTYTKLFMDYHT